MVWHFSFPSVWNKQCLGVRFSSPVGTSYLQKVLFRIPSKSRAVLLQAAALDLFEDDGQPPLEDMSEDLKAGPRMIQDDSWFTRTQTHTVA